MEGRPNSIRFNETLRSLGHLLAAQPNSTATVQSALETLQANLASDPASSLIVQRQARRARIALLKSTRQALQRLLDVLETARPAPLDQMRRLLAPAIGQLFSNIAFDGVGVSIGSGVNVREVDLLRGRYRNWPDCLADQIERHAVTARQEAANGQGDKVLRLALIRLNEVLDRQLEREKLMAPDGKPANMPRLLAFGALWDIYADLTGTGALPLYPPQDFLALCTVAFPELGLDDTGLEDAAERTFRRVHRRPSRGA